MNHEDKMIALQEEATTKWSSPSERKKAAEEIIKLMEDKE